MATQDTLFGVAHFPTPAPPKRHTLDRLHTLEVWRRASTAMAVVTAASLAVSLARRIAFPVGITSAAVFATALSVATGVAREMRLRALTIHPEFAELPAVAHKHSRLVRPRSRQALARELRATASLTRPRRRSATAVVPVLYDRIAAVRAQLLELAAALEDGHGQEPTSVAVIRELLRDGRSPLYNPNVPADDLSATLTLTLASLGRLTSEAGASHRCGRGPILTKAWKQS